MIDNIFKFARLHKFVFDEVMQDKRAIGESVANFFANFFISITMEPSC